MGTTFRQQGTVLTHVAGAAIDVNDVLVLGDTIAVALEDAAASGVRISVAIEGVHSLPKVAGTAWAQGAVLDWDASEGAFDVSVTPATGDVVGAGIAAAAALSAATAGEVKLTPGTGAVQ